MCIRDSPWGGGRGRVWGGGRGRWFIPWRGFYPPYPYQWGYASYYGGGYNPVSPSDELNYLKDQLKALEDEMEAVRGRIQEIESEEKKE